MFSFSIFTVQRISTLQFQVLLMALVYIMLKFFGGSLGQLALYPVTLFVTFLHEFGHAIGAMLTGGGVQGLQVNPDGSGYTVTQGGNPAIVLMGGYLGSAVLGNLIFYIGAHKANLTRTTLSTIAILMAFAGIIWFESLTSTALLILFGAVLWFIANRTGWARQVLMFLGLAAVLYIIQDFRVGPGSDLAMYEQVVGIFPKQVWMYVWLILAGLLFFYNMRHIFDPSRSRR